MSAAASLPVAKLKFPSQMGGGDPNFVFTRMGLLAETSSPGEWVVRENLVRTPQSTTQLVRTEFLAGPGLKSDRFERLIAPGQDEYMSHLSPDLVQAELERVREADSGSVASMLYACQVETMAAHDSELAETVRRWYRFFATKTFADDPDRLVFPNASVHWVSLNSVLYWRAWLPSMLMRLELDPSFEAQLRSGALKRGSELTFASNHELVAPALLQGNFLGPLLGCFTPRTWSVHVPRLMNSIIFNLGRTVPGQSPTPMDTLDLLPHRFSSGTASDGATEDPAIARTAWREAIDWWTLRLDQLFKFLSDPSTFRDADENYEPYRHQNWLINASELFDRVTSALRSPRDQNAATILTFSALDLVSERFLGSDTGAISTPAAADKALHDVRASMPPLAADVLLPGAERAVAALKSIAGGFFMGTDHIEISTAKHGTTTMSALDAVGPLMRARRNAVHGFGGSQAATKGAHQLLAQHKGALPEDLVYLPYLYLLKVLCNLDTLRLRIEKGTG